VWRSAASPQAVGFGALIGERAPAGVKAAQRRGVKFGSKPKLAPQQIEHARKPIDAGERRQNVARLFKVGRKTLYLAHTG
jgi:DNA invertase Pin-like site-specific DNA recombinase